MNQDFFNTSLKYSMVVEAAAQGRHTNLTKILNLLDAMYKRRVEICEQFTDPTEWICLRLLKGVVKKTYKTDIVSHLRKSAEAEKVVKESPKTKQKKQVLPQTSSLDSTQRELNKQQMSALRRRVYWLNTKGGFDFQIRSNMVIPAAAGVGDKNVIFELLDYLEAHRDEIQNATSWLCSSLASQAGNVHKEVNKLSDEDAKKLQSRIEWLNTEGGFQNLTIVYNSVYHTAMTANRDLNTVNALLDQLVVNREEIRNPTGWIWRGLIKGESQVVGKATGRGIFKPPAGAQGAKAASAADSESEVAQESEVEKDAAATVPSQ